MVRLWHAIGMGECLRLLYPTVERVGEADAVTLMRGKSSRPRRNRRADRPDVVTGKESVNE